MMPWHLWAMMWAPWAAMAGSHLPFSGGVNQPWFDRWNLTPSLITINVTLSPAQLPASED